LTAHFWGPFQKENSYTLKGEEFYGKVHFTTNNTSFSPGDLGGGKYINVPENFLQNDSGVEIRLK
jgi:hypothetical protein